MRNQRVALILHSGDHAFFIGYDIKDKYWQFIDINPRLTAKIIKIEDENQLAQIVHDGFFNTSLSIFTTEILMCKTLNSNEVNSAFVCLENLPEWNSLHKLSFRKWIRTNRSDGSFLLFCAARQGFPEIVKNILSDPDLEADDLNKRTNSGLTALYIAAQNGFLDIVNILLADPRLDPNIADSEHNTSPLSIAIQTNNESLVKALLSDFRVDPNLANCSNTTPLFKAVFNKKIKLIELLLNNSKTNPNIALKIGITPLQFAISQIHSDSVTNYVIIKQLLHNERTDPNLSYDNETYLYQAAKLNLDKLVKIFLKNTRLNPNLESSGETPLQVAVKREHYNIVELLLEDHRIDKAAISNLVKVLSDKELHFIAAQSGFVNILKLLFQSDSKVNVNLTIGSNGMTLIMSATLFNRLNIIHFLLEQGATINVPLVTSAEWLKMFMKYIHKSNIENMDNFIDQKLQQGQLESAISITALEMADILSHHDIKRALYIGLIKKEQIYTTHSRFTHFNSQIIEKTEKTINNIENCTANEGIQQYTV